MLREEFGDVETARSVLRNIVDLLSLVFDAHLCLAEFALCGATGHERLAGDALELLHVAEDAGSVQGRGLATLVLGEAQLLSDRLVEAEHYLTTARQLHRLAGCSRGRGTRHPAPRGARPRPRRPLAGPPAPAAGSVEA